MARRLSAEAKKPEPRDGKNCKHFFTSVQRKERDFEYIRNGILARSLLDRRRRFSRQSGGAFWRLMIPPPGQWARSFWVPSFLVRSGNLRPGNCSIAHRKSRKQFRSGTGGGYESNQPGSVFLPVPGCVPAAIRDLGKSPVFACFYTRFLLAARQGQVRWMYPGTCTRSR